MVLCVNLLCYLFDVDVEDVCCDYCFMWFVDCVDVFFEYVVLLMYDVL